MQQTGMDHFGSGIHRLRGRRGQHDCYAAQGVHDSQRSLRPHLSPALAHGLEVAAHTGQQAVYSSSGLIVTVVQRQSLHRLSFLISGGY